MTYRPFPMKDFDDVQQLLRLKRYESPGEEYFEKFSEQFRDRQRAELLQSSARSILAERVTVWLDEMSPGRWALPATAAACLSLLAVAGYAVFKSPSDSAGASLVETAPTSPSTLPAFDQSPQETFEVSLPKPSDRVPGEALSQGDRFFTVRAGGFREL